ncbi:MAG TPA: TonB-dependent receptor [Verrucomicrobiae bacterium]|nr:TonB-dependent receptor [Verrucomicrobiae bacterium]
MFSKKFLSGVALTALSISMSSGVAHAQSTASQIEEEEAIVVTGARRDVGGTITAETAPRARTTVTDELIETQPAGQTILQTLNLVPGLNFTNSDPYGSSGGNLTMRGFDSARISLTFDGLPLNDTGNYALYSNQQLDAELISRANVNMGTTESDSPTASATGGTVNYVTRVPDEEFGLTVRPSYGDYDYWRLFLMLDTGEVGPYGTRAFGTVSHQEYDQFMGSGELVKTQYNARLYQPLGENGDFVSLSFHYNENRNHFYRNFSLAQFESGAIPVNDPTCTRLTPGAGAQRETTTSTGTTALCNNFYDIRINPSNTGNIRGQSRFSLGENFTLTVDPSLQYTRANGGGVEAVAENDIRLRGASASTGVDLNGDGDVLDRIQLYSPSNTRTYRYGLTTSLIWDVATNHRIRVGYTYDYGRHRQTGEYGAMNSAGNPGDVFGGRNGFGTPFQTAEGDIFQKRDRASIASLSQFNAEYRGDFLDDAVTVVLGLRAPQFERELDQRCYSQKGSTSSTQFCTTRAAVASPSSAGFYRFDFNGDGDVVDNITGVFNETTDYAPPFKADVSYDDILPNLGITWRPRDGHQVFLSYAEGLSAPRTDDLYGGILVSQLSSVQPETTQSIDLGWRYQGTGILAAATLWHTNFENRIIRSQDPDDATVSFARNVGEVELWGADAQIGYQFSDALSVYGSVAYTSSELQDDLPPPALANTGKGNALIDTPEWTAALRGEYEIGGFTIGAQAKWVDERFSNDYNSEVVPSYTTVDLDLRYDFGTFFRNENTYLQLNVINLFDEEYIGTISSGANGGTGFFALGAPRTAMITLAAEF